MGGKKRNREEMRNEVMEKKKARERIKDTVE